jgi:transcription antitermination factor NusG
MEGQRMSELDQIREGQTVRVIYGPFSGMLGEVTAVDGQTVNVAVQVYGRVTPVDLASGHIESVPEESN